MAGVAARNLGLGNQTSAFGARGVSKRLNAMESLAPLEGDRLLDIGCADGTYTLRMAERFDHVDAVDIEPRRLEEFERRLAASPYRDRVSVATMSSSQLTFESATFDTVTTIEVLEHVADLERTLVNISRVLKIGGLHFLTSPNRYFPLETHGVLIGGRRYPPISAPLLPWLRPLHARLADARTFTVRCLTPMLEDHGLERVGFTYIMPPFDRSRLGQRIRPALDKLEDSALAFFGMALVMVFRRKS